MNYAHKSTMLVWQSLSEELHVIESLNEVREIIINLIVVFFLRNITPSGFITMPFLRKFKTINFLNLHPDTSRKYHDQNIKTI